MMSVMQIKGRTTNSKSEFNEAALSSNSNIFTTAEELNIEEFSIELTVGDGWNDNYSTFDKSLWKIEDCITIRGHGSIVVEVQEEIIVPYNRYGIVLPTGSLFLARGVLIASAKVEPAFAGKLKLRMFNTTENKMSIKKGDKIGSVIFFPTESTKVRDTIHRGSDISVLPASRLRMLRRWLNTNNVIWIGWIINVVCSSLVVFLLTYFFYYKPMLNNGHGGQHQTDEESKIKISKVSLK